MIPRLIRQYGRRLVLVLVVATVSFGAYVVLTSVFRLRTIEYVGQAAVIEIDESRIPGNVLFFPADKIRKTLLADHPELKDVLLFKRFPNTLRIEPIFREPVIVLSTGDRMVLVDREQVVVGYATGTERYPVVRLPVSVEKKGQRLNDPRVGTAIALLAATAPLVRFTEVTEIDSQSLSFRGDGTEIFITQNADLAKVTATLQTLIEGFRIKGTLPKIIDLRFSKPIIKN